MFTSRLTMLHLLCESKSFANKKITPLVDAVELDIATNEEALLLKEWKKYRVMLNRVDTSKAPEIDWPIALLS